MDFADLDPWKLIFFIFFNFIFILLLFIHLAKFDFNLNLLNPSSWETCFACFSSLPYASYNTLVQSGLKKHLLQNQTFMHVQPK